VPEETVEFNFQAETESVVDGMAESGTEGFISKRSSRTMEFAVRMRGSRVINLDWIEKILVETERGEFAARWMQEWNLGMPHLHRMRRTRTKSQRRRLGRNGMNFLGIWRTTKTFVGE
jgi:ketol-acid reductoisomerase